MKRAWLVIALVLSLGINAGIFVTLFKQRRAVRQRADVPVARFVGQLDRIADRLGLEGDVRERFVVSQRRFVETVRSEGRLLEIDRRRLREELTGPEPEPAEVERLVAAVGARSTELDRVFAGNVLFVRELLDGAGERRYLRLLARLYPNRREQGRRDALRERERQTPRRRGNG